MASVVHVTCDDFMRALPVLRWPLHGKMLTKYMYFNGSHLRSVFDLLAERLEPRGGALRPTKAWRAEPPRVTQGDFLKYNNALNTPPAFMKLSFKETCLQVL